MSNSRDYRPAPLNLQDHPEVAAGRPTQSTDASTPQIPFTAIPRPPSETLQSGPELSPDGVPELGHDTSTESSTNFREQCTDDHPMRNTFAQAQEQQARRELRESAGTRDEQGECSICDP